MDNRKSSDISYGSRQNSQQSYLDDVGSYSNQSYDYNSSTRQEFGGNKFMIRNNLRDKAKLIEENSSSYIKNLNAPADKDPQSNMNIQSASIYNAD